MNPFSNLKHIIYPTVPLFRGSKYARRWKAQPRGVRKKAPFNSRPITTAGENKNVTAPLPTTANRSCSPDSCASGVPEQSPPFQQAAMLHPCSYLFVPKRPRAPFLRFATHKHTMMLQSLEAKLGQISRADKAAAAAAAGSEASEGGGGAGDEDAEMGEAMTVPLEEAFMSRTEEGEVRDVLSLLLLLLLVVDYCGYRCCFCQFFCAVLVGCRRVDLYFCCCRKKKRKRTKSKGFLWTQRLSARLKRLRFTCRANCEGLMRCSRCCLLLPLSSSSVMLRLLLFCCCCFCCRRVWINSFYHFVNLKVGVVGVFSFLALIQICVCVCRTFSQTTAPAGRKSVASACLRGSSSSSAVRYACSLPPSSSYRC